MVAFDAAQGMLLANRERPALIVLDLQLPGGGGLHVLERLTASSRTLHIPVLMVTTSTEDGLEQSLRTKGARGFLAKPIDALQLTAAVTELLEEPR